MKQTELRRASEKRQAAAQRAGSTFTGPRTELLRHEEIRPVSAKRAVENRERRAMKERRWPNGERPRCARPGCPRLADDLHEILTRARGGSITDEANTLPLCRQDNDELTLEPPWGYELGLLRHSWDGPPPGEAAA